jgi:hypothetical protein
MLAIAILELIYPTAMLFFLSEHNQGFRNNAILGRGKDYY